MNDAVEQAARWIARIGSPFDATAVELSMSRYRLNSRSASHRFRDATTILNRSVEIFSDEAAMFIAPPSDMGACFSEGCHPKSRCWSEYHGVTVEHSLSGSAWLVEGHELRSKEAAERCAFATAAMRRLRAAFAGKGRR